MTTPPHQQSASAQPVAQMRHHRPSKADGLLIGALLGVFAGALIVMQCGRPEPTPPPAPATPLSTVVVVGPTQAPRTSTPRATATPRIGPLGSGGLLGR